MAIKINLKIDKKMKTFTKDKILLRDNIRAVKHQILQVNYYNSDQKDPELYEKMQLDFANMIADIFDNEFSAEQLLDIDFAEREKLDDVYILALGGTLDEKEDSDEKK